MDVPPSPATRVPRVLVVDDVVEVREVFGEFLGRAGMDVTLADGASAAIAAVRASPPDLVVTDITMPGVDGLELCRWIRVEPVTRTVPIVVVSADLSAEDPSAWEAGCDAVLAKPCSRALLVATVRRLLAGLPGWAPRQAPAPQP